MRRSKGSGWVATKSRMKARCAVSSGPSGRCAAEPLHEVHGRRRQFARANARVAAAPWPRGRRRAASTGSPGAYSHPRRRRCCGLVLGLDALRDDVHPEVVGERHDGARRSRVLRRRVQPARRTSGRSSACRPGTGAGSSATSSRCRSRRWRAGAERPQLPSTGAPPAPFSITALSVISRRRQSRPRARGWPARRRRCPTRSGWSNWRLERFDADRQRSADPGARCQARDLAARLAAAPSGRGGR